MKRPEGWVQATRLVNRLAAKAYSKKIEWVSSEQWEANDKRRLFHCYRLCLNARRYYMQKRIERRKNARNIR